MAPTVAHTLDVARSQLGITEPGLGDRAGTQITKYGKWYSAWSGLSGYTDTYWCAMWTSWVFATAGFSIAEGGRFGNCNPYIRWWKARDRWAGRNAPVIGGVVYFDWDGDGYAEHTGLVEAIRPDGRVVTIEGNATVGGGKPDGVYRMVRSRSYILGYGLPPYAPAAGGGLTGPPSLNLPGPIAIGKDTAGQYGTADARRVPWPRCPQMARGFGGPESTPQRLWAAYWFRLMGTFSPGYFKELTATAAGQAEVARTEIGPATVAVAEKMLRARLGGAAPVFKGVVPAAAWQLYQPAKW